MSIWLVIGALGLVFYAVPMLRDVVRERLDERRHRRRTKLRLAELDGEALAERSRRMRDDYLAHVSRRADELNRL